jgi:urease accessory protein
MYAKTYRWLGLAALAVAGVAQAHPGHAEGAMAGLMHPFMGWDHLLAMFAVGVWAAQLGGRAQWMLPLSFVACLTVGAGMASGGMAMPMVEGGIAASVLLLGVLIAMAVAVPSALGAAMVGLFALFHGYAHGMEMPSMSSPWQYAAGFVASSMLLHVMGVGFGAALRRRELWLRAAGAVVLMAGGGMTAGVV